MTTRREQRFSAGAASREERPVTEGLFPTGAELMLWRPGIDRRRLRVRTLRATVFSSPATYALPGATLVVIGTTPRQVSSIFVAVAVLIAAGMALAVWVDYRCADYDHQHSSNKPCFLERTRGEYFYRLSDFRDLPLSTVYSAEAIIAMVYRAYVSPAADWLRPQHLREIHQLAWDALCLLDGTRTLRALVDDPRDGTDLIRARARLTAVDDTVDSIVNSLHQVTLLVQAWEQKLAEAELRTQLRIAIGNAPDGLITSSLRRAESLAESVFADITAARDVTNSGPFVWERAQS